MEVKRTKIKKIVITMLLTPLMLLAMGRFSAAFGQDKPTLYHPEANAKEDIQVALKEARQNGKQVFIQLGGNWCSWCIAFHKFVEADSALSQALHTQYITYHLNYSPENKNTDLLKRFGFPQRFGFPCFIILNQKGDVIHIQNSAYLEKGKGYDRDKVLQFFNNWSIKATSEATYRKELGF